MAGDIRGILENILLDQNQHAPANKMIHQYFWSGLCCFMLLFFMWSEMGTTFDEEWTFATLKKYVLFNMCTVQGSTLRI